MNNIRERKLAVASMIITRSKFLGYSQRMSNGQIMTPNLLANSHTLPELKKTLKELEES